MLPPNTEVPTAAALFFLTCNTKAYSKSCQTSIMEFFAKTINVFKLLTIFEKVSIIDVHV